MGIPISIWGLIPNRGHPHTSLGINPIWGVTYTSNHPRKNSKSEKKMYSPFTPGIFWNSFDNVRNKIKILSQTKTNYIGRPSVK
jgi:hypothetical protein